MEIEITSLEGPMRHSINSCLSKSSLLWGGSVCTFLVFSKVSDTVELLPALYIEATPGGPVRNRAPEVLRAHPRNEILI